MEGEEKNQQLLEQLLAKRRKLMDLRKIITSQGHSDLSTEKAIGDSNPNTPFSNVQSSVSPPPYSPLTPLLLQTKNNDKNQLKDQPDHDSPLLEMHDDFSQPLCSPKTLNDTTPLSSPLPSMSPETLRLFNVLNDETNNIFNENNIDLSEHEDAPNYNDSDDSVRDPNYTIGTHIRNIDELETSCESFDLRRNKKIIRKSNITFEEKPKTNKRIEGSTASTTTQVKELLTPIQATGIETQSDETNADEELPNSGFGTGRPKKGRKRRNPQLRYERQYNKYNNLEYTTTNNKIVKPKIFNDYQCTCLKNCATLVSVEKRKEEFEKFVRLGSYNAQLLYIASCIKEQDKKRSYTMVNVPPEKKKPRQFHRIYSINDVQICRDMFLKTFQITTQKVTISLKKMRSGEPIMDGRGCNRGGNNKFSDVHYNFIVDIINKLPKYESHYRRENNNDTLYLQPGMTLAKIYDIYRYEYMQKYGQDSKCASIAYVKNIFYSKFNLKCKKLKKDTCNKCDMFAVKIHNSKYLYEKERAIADKTQHLERAENLRKQMNRDFKEAQSLETVECLTFDLEKTLPLPRIPTNVAFYKRQLWLYNSGIHSASDDTGHCYVWVEGDAGRGAQEVGSCLIKYFETKLRSTVTDVILWSDCCGGQNRNIKIVIMLKAVLSSHPTLQTISFRFLESGHTFLPNDTDFSKIETALKNHQRVYTADEYIDIIRNSKKKKPFQVYKMQSSDFYSSEKLEKNILNRKKFTDKTKVNWLQTKEIKIVKDKMFSIFMRSSLEEDFKELNIEKKVKGESRQINKTDFCLLWPNGKPIAPAKLADLQSMFQYIPEYCLQFYRRLKSSEEVIDDVDGFGGEIDFEIETEGDH